MTGLYRLRSKALRGFESVRMAAMFATRSPSWKAYTALFIGLVLLGFSAIFVRAAQAPGPVTGFYRMAIGSLLLALPFAQRLRLHGKLPRRGLAMAALAGVFFGLDMIAWTSGIVLSGATLPTLFANTAPLWVGIGAWLLFKEKLGPLFWVGLGLGLIGVTVILGVDVRNGLALDRGALLGLLSGLFYGSYFLAAQAGRGQLDALAFFWPAAVCSSLILLTFSLVQGFPLTGFPRTTYLNFIAQGFLIQACAWLLLSYAQGTLPASLVAPTLLGQPVLTAIFAGPLLGEMLHPVEVWGGLTVLAGILLVHRGRRPAPPTATS